ncbi:MAG: Hint domain-containing protein [Paracoccaceae bacterium]
MTWIAVTEPGTGHPAAELAHPPKPLPTPDGADMIRGSLFLEADIGRAAPCEQALFVLHNAGAVTSHLSVHLGADGTIVYGRRLGTRHRQVTLNLDTPRPEGTLRLTVSWDVLARRGLLSMELVAEGLLVQKEFAAPLPLTATDIAALRGEGSAVIYGPALSCVGLSDAVEPVGITPSLATGTPVMTPDGPRAVETLRQGDSVVTAGGVACAVRWVGTRQVPARGRFRPIRLCAPYLGLTRDVIVAPEQRILMDGAEVEYLFNAEAVLVEAHALLDTSFATREPAGHTISYHQVVLDRHEILQVAGGQMESLFVGSLRDRPELLATTVLRDMPRARLPVHRDLAFPALRDYEALTLRAALLSR